MMDFKQKIVLGFFIWGFIILLSSGLSLNQHTWFVVLTFVLTMTGMFGGKRIYQKIVDRKSRS